MPGHDSESWSLAYERLQSGLAWSVVHELPTWVKGYHPIRCVFSARRDLSSPPPLACLPRRSRWTANKGGKLPRDFFEGAAIGARAPAGDGGCADQHAAGDQREDADGSIFSQEPGDGEAAD